MRDIRVSDNGRYLVREESEPFFYLGDTAWELFHRLSRAQAEMYLGDRAGKGFTVIQAVVLAESDGLRTPNAYGDVPLVAMDPTRPNETYFEHVDWIVARAAALGLTIAMLPTWGDKWNRSTWGVGPEVFTPANASVYGEWLGRRYADQPIIWVLGGDRPIETDVHRATIEAMAAGLRAGDGGRHPMSLHPCGGQASSTYFPDAPWLDFHMVQSGHTRNGENWRMIETDYARAEIKPCMDAEPGYEDHASGFDIANGYLDDYDVRKAAYWALFAGAHGHTYGCHPIWQMWEPGRVPYTWARRTWQEALALPGSRHMGHARRLIESRPYLTRMPDQGLLLSDPGLGAHHVRISSGDNRAYVFVYIPSGRPVTVDAGRMGWPRIRAWWYDPRTGVANDLGVLDGAGELEFAPPASGPDWVLVLDDAGRGYGRPGHRPLRSRGEVT